MHEANNHYPSPFSLREKARMRGKVNYNHLTPTLSRQRERGLVR